MALWSENPAGQGSRNCAARCGGRAGRCEGNIAAQTRGKSEPATGHPEESVPNQGAGGVKGLNRKCLVYLRNS